MGVPDRVCRSCASIHDGCPATSVATCLQAQPTCATCKHKVRGRYKGSREFASPHEFFGCALRGEWVGVRNATRACGWYVS